MKQIVSKTVATLFKIEVKEAAVRLQVYAGHRGKAEAAIYVMRDVSDEERTDGVLLNDATGAFNQMNKAVAVPSLQITCNKIAMQIINTYKSPSRLFGYGAGKIPSQKGTTQNNLLAMLLYAINTSLLIQILRMNIPRVQQVWFAGDTPGARRLKQLYDGYAHLEK